jgi:8-oxo-dGTP pyrophosphatase MutT (NUDIX family)
MAGEGNPDHPLVDTQAAVSPIRVLAAVIRRNDRFLLCRRPSWKRHGGLWEFPGGKLEPGETPLEAAARELAEECCLRATELRELGGFWAVPAYSTEFVHVFEATGLREAPGGEEGIEVERRPVATALEVLNDAVSIAAFALWRLAR